MELINVLEVLRQVNAERSKKVFGKYPDEMSLSFWSNAVCGEAGEMANIIKKVERGDYSEDDLSVIKQIADEMADVIIYLDLLADRIGVNLSDSVIKKFNHVSNMNNSNIFIS